MLGPRVAFDEPLSRYTSLRVGGTADALARIDSREELRQLLELCAEAGIEVRVLGAGFNTLVRDGGVRGVVVRLVGLRRLERDAEGALLAEAGVTHSRLSRYCGEHGLAGLEFAVGIPGTVGGWLAMNAGVREREMKDTVRGVELFDPALGIERRDAAELSFRYRALELPAGGLVLAGRFATRDDEPDAVRERMKEHMARRRETQPVDRLSCGSVFKNPPGDHAGRLIEAAGLKGSREGGAEISTLHANFIVNVGDASARDVMRLIARARERVAAEFGVELETEVCVWGEDE